jgi:hypothetical protein
VTGRNGDQHSRTSVAIEDGWLSGRAGVPLELSPYAPPHPDRAAGLAWVLSSVHGGGMRAAAERGEPVSPEQFMAALGHTRISQRPPREQLVRAAWFHAMMAVEARLEDEANPYDREHDGEPYFKWLSVYARRMVRLAAKTDPDLRTPRQQQILYAYRHGHLSARLDLPESSNPHRTIYANRQLVSLGDEALNFAWHSGFVRGGGMPQRHYSRYFRRHWAVTQAPDGRWPDSSQWRPRPPSTATTDEDDIDVG